MKKENVYYLIKSRLTYLYDWSDLTCTKTSSSSDCGVNSADRTTNYNYWRTNVVDEDNTSCSSKASFSCNYNNANSTYTTCEFIKYTCDNGENLLGSYCYTIG